LASAILTSPLARAAAKGINQGNQQGNQNAPAQKVNDWFGGEPDSGLF
jgi:hypothetical protein